MFHFGHAERSVKGWWAGPWNAPIPLAVGYATVGIDEPHYHAEMYEVYLVARGNSTAVVGEQQVTLRTGSVLIVEPGEAHTFIESSPDYYHFVVHAPVIEGDKHPLVTIHTTPLAHTIAEHIAQEPFSGVIWVQQGETCLFAQAYGHAHRAEGIPNRVDTRFGIASGAKTFTAAAIGRLADAGKLDFATRLCDCLDVDFPHADPDLTLHHLLSHTSGMPDYFDEAVMDDYEALWRARPCYTMRRPADFLPLFREKPIMFPPGERFRYNNGAFVVLGLVVEQASGLPFAEYVAREVLAPAGMADSGYFALDRLPARVALGYIEEEDGWRTNIFAIPAVGGADGGLFTTAPDVARFWRALMRRELLSPETTARMLTAHTRDDDGDGYGYGLWIEGPESAPVYGMSGEDPGATFHSSYHPQHDLIITLLSNTDRPVIWELHKRISDCAIRGIT